MLSEAAIRKQIEAIKAHNAEIAKLTSRLEEGLAPVSEPAPRKGGGGKKPVHIARREKHRAKKGYTSI